MRYQELFFSASVLGAAIALHNCRHPGNMGSGPSIFQPRTYALCQGAATRFVLPTLAETSYWSSIEASADTWLPWEATVSRRLVRLSLGTMILRCETNAQERRP